MKKRSQKRKKYANIRYMGNQILSKQEYIGLLRALGISDHVVRLPDHG